MTGTLPMPNPIAIRLIYSSHSGCLWIKEGNCIINACYLSKGLTNNAAVHSAYTKYRELKMLAQSASRNRATNTSIPC